MKISLLFLALLGVTVPTIAAPRDPFAEKGEPLFKTSFLLRTREATPPVTGSRRGQFSGGYGIVKILRTDNREEEFQFKSTSGHRFSNLKKSPQEWPFYPNASIRPPWASEGHRGFNGFHVGPPF